MTSLCECGCGGPAPSGNNKKHTKAIDYLIS